VLSTNRCYTDFKVFFFGNRRSFNFGGRCKIVILAFSQCKFGGKFRVRLGINRDICLPSWVFPFLLGGLLVSAKWVEVYDYYVLLKASRNKKWKNVYSSSLHTEACNTWLVDPAICHKAFKSVVLLKGSGDKCPSCSWWDGVNWWGAGRGCYLSVGFLPAPFCPHWFSHTKTVLWNVSLQIVAGLADLTAVPFSCKSRNESRNWGMLFVVTLRFVATIETRFRWRRCQRGALREQCSAGFHLPRDNIPAVVFCMTWLCWHFGRIGGIRKMLLPTCLTEINRKYSSIVMNAFVPLSC